MNWPKLTARAVELGITGARRLLACNVCNVEVDPSDLPLTVWVEHDEKDRPVIDHDALLFVGQGSDHACCHKAIEQHPRLYSEVEGRPGHFPGLCGPCAHRDDLSCRHHDLRANGGAGLSVTLDGMTGFICRRGKGHGCTPIIRHARNCAGRRVLEVVP